MTRKERERLAKQRPAITKEIARLERKFGESAVSGAFDRYRRARSLRRKLRAQRATINAEIKKLA